MKLTLKGIPNTNDLTSESYWVLDSEGEILGELTEDTLNGLMTYTPADGSRPKARTDIERDEFFRFVFGEEVEIEI